jgi:hypothetical protein
MLDSPEGSIELPLAKTNLGKAKQNWGRQQGWQKVLVSATHR